jgi:hypothetical protein
MVNLNEQKKVELNLLVYDAVYIGIQIPTCQEKIVASIFRLQQEYKYCTSWTVNKQAGSAPKISVSYHAIGTALYPRKLEYSSNTLWGLQILLQKVDL